MKITRIIAGFMLMILLTQCGDNQPENFDYGQVKDDVYQNEYFDFSIKLPTNWVVQTQEQSAEIAKTGAEMMAGDNEAMKAALDASKINSANLLAIFQYELNSPVDFNPSLVIVAENVKGIASIKNGSDYLASARKLLEQSEVKYDSIFDTQKEMVNETEFYRMDAQINYMGLVKQTYYSTVTKDFSLNFIITYTNDEQKQTLMNSINTIEFEK